VIESEGVECRGGYIIILGGGNLFYFLRFLFTVLCKTGFLISPHKASRHSDAWLNSVILGTPWWDQ